MGRGAGRPGWVAVVVLAALIPAAATAQRPAPGEAARLAEAGRLEARGALAEAERTLRAVVSERAESLPALLALERVLRIQGRLDELPPLLDAALAGDPESTDLRALQIRTWSALDRVDALEAAADAWIAASPGLEVPYREVARVWRDRGEHARARRVLESGRRRIGSDDALALELGDVYAELGEPGLAAREWARAVAPGGRGGSQLRRRLRSLPDGGADIVGALVDELAADSSPGRLDVALDLAMDAGLERRAREIAGSRFAPLDSDERRTRLLELALEADGREMRRVAYWAYGRLVGEEPAPSGGEYAVSPVIRSRVAALAAELADTTAEVASRGTPEAADGAGDAVDAGRSAALRGRQLLEAGDVDGARAAYLRAAPDLRGAEATTAISLAALLGRLSPTAGALLSQALRRRDEESPAAAVAHLRAGVDGLEAGDRAAVLGFAARLADGAGLESESRSIRRRIVDEHPGAPEAPAALLALARELEGDRATRPEARALLERLILEYPTSALVPQARRALDRLKREGVA